MLIPISWINELIDIEKISLNSLVEKLTLAGFEVEDIIETIIFQNKEIVLDISATANRSDSISVRGIVEEISALTNISRRMSSYNSSQFNCNDQIRNHFKVETKNLLNDCSIFSNLIVTNLTNKPSPKWIKKKLIACGVTVENNLIDIQNYILLETGYPFEFYDLEKISNTSESNNLNIKLQNLEKSITITGTNDIEYKLDHETPVITANNNIISIAGIIPNQAYEYTSNTKSLLIEGSIFGSKKIRQISRKIGVRTDRSARYEKGLNSGNFIDAASRLILLLQMYDDSLEFKLHTAIQIPQQKPNIITLKYNNLIEILGPIKVENEKELLSLDPKIISNYLERLNFEIEFDQKKLEWLIRVPESRTADITREIDLIEEIARLHGFNNFTSFIPTIVQIGKQDSNYQIRKKFINCFLNEGLNELIKYSLVKDNFDYSIKLINPLLQDCSFLRQTGLLNLVTASSENIKQANLPIEGFEFGHNFYTDNKNNYKEKEVISGIFGGRQKKINWSEKSKSLSWFEAKGKIEKIFTKLKINVTWEQKQFSNFGKVYENVFHPYRTANLLILKNQSFGIFGQIHPLLAKKMSLPIQTYLFEFDFNILCKHLEKNNLILYKNYSSYPKVIKDISFIINENITYSEITDLISKNGSQFLTNITLLDQYKGKDMPKNTHSLCIQLTFQSNKSTLITSEIEKILSNVNFILEKELNAVFRF